MSFMGYDGSLLAARGHQKPLQEELHTATCGIVPVAKQWSAGVNRASVLPTEPCQMLIKQFGQRNQIVVTLCFLACDREEHCCFYCWYDCLLNRNANEQAGMENIVSSTLKMRLTLERVKLLPAPNTEFGRRRCFLLAELSCCTVQVQLQHLFVSFRQGERKSFFLSELSRFRGHVGYFRKPAADWIQPTVYSLTGIFSPENTHTHTTTFAPK